MGRITTMMSRNTERGGTPDAVVQREQPLHQCEETRRMVVDFRETGALLLPPFCTFGGVACGMCFPSFKVSGCVYNRGLHLENQHHSVGQDRPTSVSTFLRKLRLSLDLGAQFGVSFYLTCRGWRVSSAPDHCVARQLYC